MSATLGSVEARVATSDAVADGLVVALDVGGDVGVADGGRSVRGADAVVSGSSVGGAATLHPASTNASAILATDGRYLRMAAPTASGKSTDAR
jgi:hypothetical protein